ncbi:MAG TPA: hypothetical protein VGD99_22290 [Anaerolineae bacterium]|jgi:hypothetical protein
MKKLAQKDIKAYFAHAVPERPLSAKQLEAIRQATLGIPLAIRTAADIWKKTGRLDDIVGDPVGGVAVRRRRLKRS